MAITLNGTTGLTTPSGVFQDASGNAGVGTTSPNTGANVGKFSVQASQNFVASLYRDSVNPAQLAFLDNNNSCALGTDGASNMVFYNNSRTTERMRIDSSGNLLVGTTTPLASGSTFTTANSARFAIQNTNASPLGLYVNYSTGPNGTGNEYIYCSDTSIRMTVRSNGGIANFSANNVNLSDAREKKDFSLAKNYLDVICAIPVQTFKYIDQTDDEPTLGVVAQDVEAVAPELVSESNWGTEEEPKMRLAVYQTDLQYALMKCIQELSAKVTALEAKVNNV